MILFFGAAWGLIEATLGHCLHVFKMFVPLPLTGLVMFPAGFYFMMRAFKETGSTASIALTGCVAATIKMTDLFLPAVPPEFVVHPALAILLESAGCYIYFKSFKPVTPGGSFAAGTAVSFLWRTAFVAGLLLFPVFPGIASEGTRALAVFLLAESVVNGIMIASIVRLDHRGYSLYGRLAFHPAVAPALFAVAAASQIFLK